MKAIAILPLAALAACSGKPCPPPGIKYVPQEKIVETQVPCKVVMPKRPDPVAVKPGDDAYALNLRYKAKLEEWGGPGESYANLAEAALRACQKAGKP